SARFSAPTAGRSSSACTAGICSTAGSARFPRCSMPWRSCRTRRRCTAASSKAFSSSPQVDAFPMALNAELTSKLDANSLVQAFLGDLSGSSGSLNAIASPASPDQLTAAAGTGNSFLPAPLLDAVGRFANVALPSAQIPATITRIETALTAIEGFTTRDLGADLTSLAEQLKTELEGSNEQGIPGTVLKVADLLTGSPTFSSVRDVLSGLMAGVDGPALPDAITDYLPAFASTVRTIAGLMVYETVLAEGERLTAIVGGLFTADRAQRLADGFDQSLRAGTGTLAQALAAADGSDTARVDALIAALEKAAAQLAALDSYEIG